MGVNDDLADDAIMRSIRSMRATNALWAELLPILRRAERDLLARLEDGAPRTVSSRRAQALLNEIRKVISGGADELHRRLEEAGKTIAGAEEAAAFKSLGARVPVDVDWVRPSARLLEAVATVAPFEGAILRDHLDKWTVDTIFAMQAEIRTGIVIGEGIEPMQRRLRRVADIKIREARTIARTYTSHVTNEARAALYAQNADVIAKEQWVATLDDRTCIRCAALDGETFSLGKGVKPPLHMNCRCVRIPITRGRDDLIRRGILPEGSRASMDGQVPADMRYPQWLSRQSEEAQKETLGKARYEMFKSGTTFDKFVNDENEIIPLRDL